MSDTERMREIKTLIRFYERHGWNWLLAAGFLLSKQYPPICEHICGNCRRNERAA